MTYSPWLKPGDSGFQAQAPARLPSNDGLTHLYSHGRCPNHNIIVSILKSFTDFTLYKISYNNTYIRFSKNKPWMLTLVTFVKGLYIKKILVNAKNIVGSCFLGLVPRPSPTITIAYIPMDKSRGFTPFFGKTSIYTLPVKLTLKRHVLLIRTFLSKVLR